MATNDAELMAAVSEVSAMTPKQITETLMRRKIRGRPGTVGRCPLALMMHGARGGHFYVGEKYIIRQSGSRVSKVKTPKNLAAFVRMFDKGDIPSLIAPPPRCIARATSKKPRASGPSGKHHIRKRGGERLQLARQVGRILPGQRGDA